MKKNSGFTLVELLVVISIITILALIGMVIYTNIQRAGRDAKRKGDVQAISKALEVAYVADGSYAPVNGQKFSSGAIPVPPEGGNYAVNFGSGNQGYQVCTSLEGHPTGTTCDVNIPTCYCIRSSQERYVAVATTPAPTPSVPAPTGDPGGGPTPTSTPTNPLQHPLACDPGQTLDDGLIGYWKFDEVNWNGTNGEVRDSTNNNNGKSTCGGSGCLKPVIVTGKFGNAGSFQGNYDWDFSAVDFGATSAILNNLTAYTFSAWIKMVSYPISDDAYIIQKGDTSLGGRKFLQVTSDTGNLKGMVLHTSATPFSESNEQIPLNSWQLITTTFNGAGDRKVRLYINRTEVSYAFMTDASGSLQSDNTLRIGETINDTPPYLIDDVRIYNRVLSDTETNALYSGGAGCVP